ncbi:MAG TPA: hypothetical protein VIM95_09625, partial [Chitinimonas sp.]
TDPSPPNALSARLGVDAMRVEMADQVVDPATRQVMEYGATILECHSKGVERRHIFVANDGGRWKFGQFGEPFPFEDTMAYQAKSIKARFTHAMLLAYVKELGVTLAGSDAPMLDSGQGYLLTKHGKMPATYKEFAD